MRNQGFASGSQSQQNPYNIKFSAYAGGHGFMRVKDLDERDRQSAVSENCWQEVLISNYNSYKILPASFSCCMRNNKVHPVQPEGQMVQTVQTSDENSNRTIWTHNISCCDFFGALFSLTLLISLGVLGVSTETWITDMNVVFVDDATEKVSPVAPITYKDGTPKIYKDLYDSFPDTCNYSTPIIKETWNEQSTFRYTLPTNSHKVNLVHLVFTIYFVSFIFQLYRACAFTQKMVGGYRPLGPDMGRWIEYFITSPLMIFVIAISVGVTEASLLVTIVFLQASLIVLGYVLERLIEEYLAFSKHEFLARNFAKGLKELGKLELSFDQKTFQENEDSVRRFTSVGGDSFPLLLDDFFETISDPRHQMSCQMERKNTFVLDRLNLFGRKKTMFINALYLFAFCIFGVVWSVIIAQFRRTSHSVDCSIAETSIEMPAEVQFIVYSQCAFFFIFGMISVWGWIRFQWFKGTWIQNSQKDRLLREQSRATEFREFNEKCIDMWLSLAWKYSFCNVTCKLALEVGLLIYLSSVESELILLN